MRANASRPGRPRRPRPSAPTAALALALLLAASPAAAASVVSSVTLGGDDGNLLVEIAASGPLGYLLSEGHAPFTLSLVFTDARFAFAATRRAFEGDGLVAFEARTLTRGGSTVAKLDLTFAREAPYEINREPSRMRIRVEVPGKQPALVITSAGPSPPPGPAAAEPAAGASDGVLAVLRQVHPESSAEGARLSLDLDGAAAVQTHALERPARVVVDLVDARVLLPNRTIAVGQGLLREVRIAQRTATAVRVVCELTRPAPYRVEPTAQGLILYLGEGVR